MAKPPPPERPRSRRRGSLSAGEGARRRACPGRPAAAGVVNLTQVARGWEGGVRGSGSAGKGRPAGRRRSAAHPLAAAPAVSCSPAPHAPRLSLGHRAPRRSATCQSERSRPLLSGLHAPRYITHDREEPAAASAHPPLGPPRTPPSAQPPARPPSAEPRRDSPSHMAVAAASSLRRTSLRGSRPLPWGVPTAACQAWRSTAPWPSSYRCPILACPCLATLVNRGTPGPARLQSGAAEDSPSSGRDERTSAARPPGCRSLVSVVGREPKRRSKSRLSSSLESQLALCNTGQKALIFPGWNHHRGGAYSPGQVWPSRRAGNGTDACRDL